MVRKGNDEEEQDVEDVDTQKAESVKDEKVRVIEREVSLSLINEKLNMLISIVTQKN
jgi:hypothetical protein